MANEMFQSVEVPSGLDEKQAEIARMYTKAVVIEGKTVKAFWEETGVSTNTLYNARHLKNTLFKRYVHAMTAAQSIDEVADFKVIAQMVKADAIKPNSTFKEREMYFKLYSWLGDYISDQGRKEYGLSSNEQNSMSVEERKASLLTRLQPDKKEND